MKKAKHKKIGKVYCEWSEELENFGQEINIHFCFGTYEGDGQIEKVKSDKGRTGYYAHAEFLDRSQVFLEEASALRFLADSFAGKGQSLRQCLRCGRPRRSELKHRASRAPY